MQAWAIFQSVISSLASKSFLYDIFACWEDSMEISMEFCEWFMRMAYKQQDVVTYIFYI